jgi:KDO2-lipid IV(A) lauroyltransferase
MGSAARYYAEILELPRVSGDTIDARVRFANPEAVREALRTHGHTVVALSHSGNWDLIGAYACRHLAPVTSVAEILRPRSVFDEFVAFREKLGMTIVGHEGSTTFRELIRLAKSQGGVIALVADRDMSGSGLPVTMWGHEVKVAAGPAALAVSTSSTLFGVMIHYERLRGARRRQARSRWGIVATFSEPILAPEGSTRDQVTSMTDSWVGFIEDAIAQHPQDWHMLQRFGWVS